MMNIPQLNVPLAFTPFRCLLRQRSLLRVSGIDTHEFLQGLFTNQLTALTPGGAQYGCFLYFTGRVLADAKFYQSRTVHEGQASVLVDVHAEAKEALQDHLEEMVMRKKVKVEDVSGSLAVVAQARAADASPAAPATATPTTIATSQTEVFTDPWTPALLPNAGAPAVVLEKHIMPRTWVPTDVAHDASSPALYEQLLCLSGIGEGPAVFRHNKSLPFEGNIDFLDGVNFHKGCYVGQELTHRTHVMLVTRKRTVPIIIHSRDGNGGSGVRDTALYSTEKEKIGEVLVSGPLHGGPAELAGAHCGLALLRLRYVNKESRTVTGLHLKDGTAVTTWLPSWWPPKEVKKLLKNNE